jgi:hypothetical protein
MANDLLFCAIFRLIYRSLFIKQIEEHTHTYAYIDFRFACCSLNDNQFDLKDWLVRKYFFLFLLLLFSLYLFRHWFVRIWKAISVDIIVPCDFLMNWLTRARVCVCALAIEWRRSFLWFVSMSCTHTYACISHSFAFVFLLFRFALLVISRGKDAKQPECSMCHDSFRIFHLCLLHYIIWACSLRRKCNGECQLCQVKIDHLFPCRSKPSARIKKY